MKLFRNKQIWYYKNDKKIYGKHTLIWGDVSVIWGDVSGIWGDVSGIWGDVSVIRGNVSGIWGDVSGIKGDIKKEILTFWNWKYPITIYKTGKLIVGCRKFNTIPQYIDVKDIISQKEYQKLEKVISASLNYLKNAGS